MQFHSLKDDPRKNVSHRLWYPAQPYLSSSFRRSLAVILPLVVLWCTSVHALRYYHYSTQTGQRRSSTRNICQGLGALRVLLSPKLRKQTRYRGTVCRGLAHLGEIPPPSPRSPGLFIQMAKPTQRSQIPGTAGRGFSSPWRNPSVLDSRSVRVQRRASDAHQEFQVSRAFGWMWRVTAATGLEV